MAVGDRYQIIDSQLFLDQGILNVYHYLGDSGTNVTASTCVAMFTNNMLPSIRSVQNSNLGHVAYTCINLDDVTDFGAIIPSPADAGLATGSEPMASFMAWSFIYVRASRGSRNGWKRIAGLQEDMVSGNGVAAGWVDDVNDLASQMETTQYWAGAYFKPVILRRNVVPALSTHFYITGVSFKGITTQNTRKPGRGM